MKNFFRNMEQNLADAALLEMGVGAAYTTGALNQASRRSLEESFVEIAFAEASDYEDIHRALLREHFKADDQVHNDECQYGDNEACFVR